MRHGRAAYAKGCRCAVCREARRVAGARYRAGERAPVPDGCRFCGAPLPRNRGKPREYCSRRCQRLAARPLCACGAPKCPGSARCQRCAGVAARDQELRAQVVRLWAEGKTYRELAELLDRSVRSVGEVIYRLRAEGLDLPYRYRRAPRHVR